MGGFLIVAAASGPGIGLFVGGPLPGVVSVCPHGRGPVLGGRFWGLRDGGFPLPLPPPHTHLSSYPGGADIIT